MMRGLKKVFQFPSYVFLATIIAFIVFSFAVLLPNVRLIAQIIPDTSINIGLKFQLFVSLFESINTNFTTFSAVYTIMIALLFGINVSLFVFYIREQRAASSQKSSVIGLGGLVSGIFGIGCAACGTFILTWLLGLIGAAGAISYLPFGGGEFGVLGVVLLVYAAVITANKIDGPKVC